MDGNGCVVNSFNEWDPLEEVIVGTCFGACSMSLNNEPVLENLLGRNFKGFLGQGTERMKISINVITRQSLSHGLVRKGSC
jgi:hypothetical protein